MAAGWEMKSLHQEKRQLLAARGCGCARPVLSKVRETDPGEFEQMRDEFLLMVQCFYVEYLETSKNHGTSRWKTAFPYKNSPWESY